MTVKVGKSIRLRNKDCKSIENILNEFKNLIRYLNKYGSRVILRIVDCPLLSISKWNTKHLKPSNKEIEKYRKEDKLLTEQLTTLNKRIWQLNLNLGFQPIKTSQFYFRTRGGKNKTALRHYVRITLNKEDGVHPGKTISLIFCKLLLLDSYKECFISIPNEERLQVLVEEEELLSLKL